MNDVTNSSPARQQAVSRGTQTNKWKLFATLCALLLATGGRAQATELVGQWELDAERTEAIQPEQPQQKQWLKGQNISTSVSYGGQRLPTIRRKIGAMSSLSERDPEVLRCKEMVISNKGDDLLFTYVDVGSEVRQKGKKRGFNTAWNKKKLTDSYKTTTRKVSHTFAIQDDESLLVTVLIKPNKGPKRIYKQVFNRKS